MERTGKLQPRRSYNSSKRNGSLRMREPLTFRRADIQRRDALSRLEA
jgi:hypothetical protein